MPVCVNRGNPIPQISLFGRQSVDKNGKEKSQITDLQRFGIVHGDPGEDANGANNMHNKKYCCILVFIVLSELKR